MMSVNPKQLLACLLFFSSLVSHAQGVLYQFTSMPRVTTNSSFISSNWEDAYLNFHWSGTAATLLFISYKNRSDTVGVTNILNVEAGTDSLNGAYISGVFWPDHEGAIKVITLSGQGSLL